MPHAVSAPTCVEVVNVIGRLCKIERDLANPHALEGADCQRALAHIRAIRERHVPIVDQIKAWADPQTEMAIGLSRRTIAAALVASSYDDLSSRAL